MEEKNKKFNVAHHNLLDKMDEIYDYIKVEMAVSSLTGYGEADSMEVAMGDADLHKLGSLLDSVYTKEETDEQIHNAVAGVETMNVIDDEDNDIEYDFQLKVRNGKPVLILNEIE